MLAVGASLLLAAAGCGGGGSTQAKSAGPLPSTPAPTSSSAPASPSTNAHGYLDKAIGQEAGIHDASGTIVLRFTVDQITVDPACDQPYVKAQPQNGHLVALKIRASTATNMSTVQGFGFNPSDFGYIGPDGITHRNVSTGASYSCLQQSEMLPSGPLGGGQQYVGSIVLDVPGTAGSIIYTPAMFGNNGGWEWKF